MKKKWLISTLTLITFVIMSDKVLGGRSGALWLLTPIYNFCSILVVKRMGAEYMEGALKRIKNEPVTT